MHSVKIKKNKNGDTRTAEHIPTYDEFHRANLNHCVDVANMMYAIAREIEEIGNMHDKTKLDELGALFYDEFCKAMNGDIDFEDGKWIKMHYHKERHHLDKYVPKNVNLFDVLEMIVDCVCAGMARSGDVRPIHIISDVLQLAVQNTTELLKNHVRLCDG